VGTIGASFNTIMEQMTEMSQRKKNRIRVLPAWLVHFPYAQHILANILLNMGSAKFLLHRVNHFPPKERLMIICNTNFAKGNSANL